MAKCNNRSSHVNVASMYWSSEKVLYWSSIGSNEHVLVMYEGMLCTGQVRNYVLVM